MYLKRSVVLIALLFAAAAVQCQTFTASANKKAVAVNDYFILSFTINANGGNFRPPDFSDFDIYSGPNQSTNMSIINGVISQSVSYTYYLIAKKEGKFTIGPAKINANGKQLESNAVTIEVVKGNSATASTNGTETDQAQQISASGNGNEVFVRTYVNKQKCYQGEQIVVTQKIYSLYQIRGIQNYKAPSYTGFWNKEEDRSAQLVQKNENIDGTNYFVLEFNKAVLFPLKSGSLTVDPAEVDVVASIQSRRRPRSIFEQFFGTGHEDKLFKLRGKPITINVTALPETGKPAGFTGAVGSFSFKTELDHDRVKENEAINLKLVISGKGNINLAGNPKINFPAEFETYEPKVTENVSVGAVVSGSKTYEYLLIPRKRGTYTIKDFDFSYFDSEKKQYVTIPSPELNITVEPGAAGSGNAASVYVPKNEVQTTENDIRYIKRGDLELKEQDTEFFSSSTHYTFMGVSLLAFIGAIAMRKRIAKANSDIVRVKERKAAGLAKKKLAEAEKHKNNNNKELFYNEISVALYKYISDKMHIPLADLSRDNIAAHTIKKNIDEQTREKLLKTLDDCEYARFAPAAAADNLEEIYRNTIELITQIEEQSKA